MDQEIREGFASVMGMLEGVAADARSANANSIEAVQRVGKLERELEQIRRHLFGSEPPPNGSTPSKKPAPLAVRVERAAALATTADKRASSASIEVAELRGEVIGRFARLRSEAIGVLVRAGRWVRTREGRVAIASIVVLLGAAASCVGVK